MDTTSDSTTPETQAGAGGAPPPPTVWPTLRYRDAPAMITFLTDVLGFTRTAVYADGDLVEHAQLGWPEGGGVMLGSVRDGSDWEQPPGGAGCYVVTRHVDEIFRRAQAAGADIRMELQEEDYGNRSFVVADPEGNLWSFGHYAGEPDNSGS